METENCREQDIGFASRLAGSVLVAGQALAQPVSITGVNFNGTGCKGKNATAQLFDVDMDGLDDQFQILYSNYIVKQPGGAFRKNRTTTVTLNLPRGFQFSIANASHIGFVNIPARGKGTQESAYLFPLNPQGAEPRCGPSFPAPTRSHMSVRTS